MRDLDDTLRKYGDLTIRIGLNLQPGQRLAIIGPLANGGVSLDAAPLVRCLTEAAYRAGASYVEAIWGDEALQLARFSHALLDQRSPSPMGQRHRLRLRSPIGSCFRHRDARS